MAASQPAGNRHHWRVWLKGTIETGVLDRVPPRYDPDGSGDPQPTDDYARGLLAELKDPESSGRPLRDVIADARRFRAWVEHRQKVSRRMILGQWETEGAADWIPEARRLPPREKAPRHPGPRPSRPEADPLWDVWLDG